MNTFPNFQSFVLQNETFSWDADLPDLTTCFQNTVLVWIPCAFLLLFSGIELLRICRWSDADGKETHIPWTLVSGSRILLTGLLMLVSSIELVYGIIGVFSGVSFPRPLCHTSDQTVLLCTRRWHNVRESHTSCKLIRCPVLVLVAVWSDVHLFLLFSG